jgi:TonB-dependent receptor
MEVFVRKLLTIASLLIVLNWLGTSTAWTQAGRSTIAGRLTDAGGGVLQGARVTLQPGGLTTVSNNQGEYSLPDVPPGNYELTVSFIGFDSATQSVTVNAGQPAKVDVVLQVGGRNEEVLVTAERQHAEAEEINRTRTAENILQVLSAEVITSLPNANVADAIGRMPSVTLERDEGEGKYVQIRGTEPRYSNVTIDGVNVPSPENVRQIKLDIVPSDLVESVEINKTLLANMDGDAIGGSVNLRTKSAGDSPFLSFYGMGGYTPIISGRGLSQFGGTASHRFGPQKKFGVLFGGTYDWNGRGINDIEPSPCDLFSCGTYNGSGANVATYNSIDIRDYRYYRGRWGFTGSLDYKMSENSNVYAHGLYSHFENYGDRWVYSPTINTYLSSTQGDNDGNMTANAQIRRPVQVIGSLALGGHHVFGSSVASWEMSASRSATEDKGYSTANFAPVDDNSPLNNVQFGLNLTNPNRPRFIVQNGVNIYDPSGYFLQNLDVNKTYSPQVNLQGGASYAKSYKWGSNNGTFELGGKFRNAHKFQDAVDQYFNAVNPGALPMTNFQGSFSDPDYYDKSYAEGPFANYSKITSFFNSTPAAFSLNFNKTRQRNDPQNYNIVERISAGYLMNSVNLGHFRLYSGVRFEGTTENLLGYHVTSLGSTYVSTTPLRQNSDYVDALPSAELRYRLTDDSSIRFAYSRGIARPNFSDLPPFLTEDDKRKSVSAGNPNLKPTHANNYDFLFEQYFKPLGMFQAGFFYKDLTDPIFAVTTQLTSGAFAGFSQRQAVNGSSGSLTGFEVAYQQHLTFLPDVWSGLGISTNYSYTTSQANGLPGRSDHPSLQRQAPHTWNISPTYDRGRFSMRVGLAYNAANIFSYNYSDGAPLGIKGPNGDQYLYAHLQVDAQGSLRIAKGFTAVVYGLNLNNEVFGFYQGSGIYPIQREYYKPSVAAGVRWNLSQER